MNEKDGKGDKKEEQFNAEKILQQLQNEAIIVEIQSENKSYDGVKGHDDVRDLLQQAMSFKDSAGPRKILLYGVAGTGKSYMVKAVGKKAILDGTAAFYSIQSCTFMSKYFNFTGRFNQLFQLAINTRPSVVFFDDLDSLFGGREPIVSEQHTKLREEFVECMKRVDEKVLIVAAAIIPETMHPDVLACFDKFVPMSLPDEVVRAALFQFMFQACSNSLTDDDYQTFAEKTDGFSKSDIASVINSAVMCRWRKVRDATHFCRTHGCLLDQPDVTSDNLFTPCTPDHPDAVEMDFTEISEDELQSPVITMEDVLATLETTQASTTAADIQRIEDFQPPLIS